jgi:hypothetical protein
VVPDQDHQSEQKVEDLDVPIARINFRVVVIRPDKVEMCDITKEPTKARRHKYTLVQERNSETGEVEWKWTDEELCP